MKAEIMTTSKKDGAMSSTVLSISELKMEDKSKFMRFVPPLFNDFGGAYLLKDKETKTVLIFLIGSAFLDLKEGAVFEEVEDYEDAFFTIVETLRLWNEGVFR